MVTNPNIILSGNQMAAPQLPDVNAVMQTRTAGMEGMIQMERQREADALSAQERETDAAAKAMAPAIASAFSDPSDEGLDIALSMVPAQYQAAATAQIDQLRAVPDLNRRKDIIRAGLAQDDYGRAILAQLEPTANMRLQADTAAQAQALRMRDLQLQERQAAEGPAGDFATVETDRGIYIYNKKTGKGRLLTAGEVAPPAAPSGAETPGVVTPRQPAPAAVPAPTAVPAPAAAAVPAPISTQQPPQDNVLRPPPKAAATEQTQEERRRSASVRYTVKNADRVSEVIDKDPAAFGQGADEFLLSIIPFGAGQEFLSFVQDANRQQVYYRMTQIVATLLRLETGAAYTTSELVTESASFMPKYGDDPETARDKLDALQDRVTSAVGSTGRGWTPKDQAEYDAAMMALEAMKDKVYPVGGGSGGGELPEGATTSNW